MVEHGADLEFPACPRVRGTRYCQSLKGDRALNRFVFMRQELPNSLASAAGSQPRASPRTEFLRIGDGCNVGSVLVHGDANHVVGDRAQMFAECGVERRELWSQGVVVKRPRRFDT